MKIIPVGGYGEIGRNCTAIDIDGDIFILDLGIHLENYVRVTEDDDLNYKLSKSILTKAEAIPDISVIDPKKVKAVLLSHAHLDHVGAVPFLGDSFNCDIHGTGFTVEVTRRLCEDKKRELRNELVAHKYREVFELTPTVKAEFIEVTHSTPQSAAIALHTPEGVVLYVNDFKLDKTPTMGDVTDLDRLGELHPKVLIMDTLYADRDEHTPSESYAKELLESALLDRDLSSKAIIASTFASQIARIAEMVSIAEQLNRKVMVVGRSMVKYLEAAKDCGISDIIDKHEVVRYSSRARKALAKVANAKDYFFIVTGGMAEPKAVLSRIVEEELIPLRRHDLVVFSNKIIPTPTIIPMRKKLESKLQSHGFEVLKDLHASGHGSGKDIRDLLSVVRPGVVLPVHGEAVQRDAFVDIANDMDLDVAVLGNGERFSPTQ